MFFNPYDTNEIWVTSFGNGMRLGRVNEPRPVLLSMQMTNATSWITVQAAQGQNVAVDGVPRSRDMDARHDQRHVHGSIHFRRHILRHRPLLPRGSSVRTAGNGNLGQWQLFAVPTRLVDQRLGNQRSVSLGVIESLGACPVYFRDLTQAVESVIS